MGLMLRKYIELRVQLHTAGKVRFLRLPCCFCIAAMLTLLADVIALLAVYCVVIKCVRYVRPSVETWSVDEGGG